MNRTRKDISSLACMPCRGGIPPLIDTKIREHMKAVLEWRLKEDGPNRIEKTFKFKDFNEAMSFVNKVADVAEKQDHHPVIFIHWNRVTLTFWNHSIDGLHYNDFIMAAKIDRLYAVSSKGPNHC
ncbi:MAG: 4a-hydroxytetrahydrobiopterin dehydratase [Candidatus Hodarchaeota archaeon]